jgi:hypothetical protein
MTKKLKLIKRLFNYGKPVLALYGNVAIEKAYCTDCDGVSFIRNGKFVCCDNPVLVQPQKFHRETEAPQHRKTPPKAEKDRILEEQEHRCL